MAAKGKKLLFIIVDLSPVTDIDASAVHFLMVIPSGFMDFVKSLLWFS